MGRALEVIAGRVVAGGAQAETALTPNTGNSFTVRDFSDGASATLYSPWVQAAGLSRLRIRSPRLHDAAQSIRLVADASGRILLPMEIGQSLEPNDPLIVELSSSAAETDAAAYLVYYSDLNGADARLLSLADIQGRVRNITGILNTFAVAVGGDWSGQQAINADQDSLKADTDYAILGATMDVASLAVRIQGIDFGNLGVGIPGALEPIHSSRFFVDLSEATGQPCIPVFNSNNRGTVLVDAASVAAIAAFNVTIILAELG
jgi:hypothetical protein